MYQSPSWFSSRASPTAPATKIDRIYAFLSQAHLFTPARPLTDPLLSDHSPVSYNILTLSPNNHKRWCFNENFLLSSASISIIAKALTKFQLFPTQWLSIKEKLVTALKKAQTRWTRSTLQAIHDLKTLAQSQTTIYKTTPSLQLHEL
eukprot:TRINITY_DN3594_c0_g1_i3.p1 TRINITY_DN3594_c0_g1~~TRINITY_DN3594_c0_g1_i3.p1  ORF type:complete len:148 (-),score=12.60 TRINITY_DN3594_c0_g1_i3:16-459(-)